MAATTKRRLLLSLVVAALIGVVPTDAWVPWCKHGLFFSTCATRSSSISSVMMASAAPSTSTPNGKKQQPSEPVGELKEYKAEAAGLFGNIRIPAALFAGASAASAFSLPVTAGVDTLKVGLIKRLYALLMMGALTSELIAVVVSTLAFAMISTQQSVKTASAGDLLREHYALEWVSARLHFLSGVLMFMLAVGIRAWVTIACPIIARAALGIVLSSAVLCTAFIQELDVASSIVDGVFRLPIRYIQLMTRKAKTRPFFAIAYLMSLTTTGYIIGNIPHVVKWLAKTGG